MEFRELRADEIDVRIGSISKEGKGLSLLLYKDARCDMNILDEKVGAENWQRNHEVINGNLFCNVGIFVNNQWVWKQDVGTESNTEKEKGESSDSFKRACFCWGIGRELYTAPLIWFNASDVNLSKDNKCFDKFIVKEIGYTDHKISKLWIYNTKTKKSFKYGYGKEADELTEEEKFNEQVKEELKEKATQAQINALKEIAKKHNVNLDAIYVSNNCTEETLNKEQATYLLNFFNEKYQSK